MYVNITSLVSVITKFPATEFIYIILMLDKNTGSTVSLCFLYSYSYRITT